MIEKEHKQRDKYIEKERGRERYIERNRNRERQRRIKRWGRES